MAPRRSPLSFRTIEDVVQKETEFSRLRETVKNYDVVEEFERIFPELKPIAQAVKVDKQILFLRVENSVWKSELNLQKNIITEKINRYFKEPIIKSIRFL